MASTDGRSPNDQRSDVKNPNNREHQQDRDNRSKQLNPEHPAHQGERKER